jgi:glycyl-tRNA synthetase beta chain
MADFLLEIGCEEIPARMIDKAQEELAFRVGELLARESLGSPAGVSAPVTTPRRLSVLASVRPSQDDVVERISGPSVTVAYKNGEPTPAAHAFAKKAGVEVAMLEKVTTAKGEYLSASVTRKGRSASEILSERLPKEISAIYWPKNMYWRKTNERFVRPAGGDA